MRKKLYFHYTDFGSGVRFGTVEMDEDDVERTEDSITTWALKTFLRKLTLHELDSIKEVRMIEVKQMGNFTDQAKAMIEKRQL